MMQRPGHHHEMDHHFEHKLMPHKEHHLEMDGVVERRIWNFGALPFNFGSAILKIFGFKKEFIVTSTFDGRQKYVTISTHKFMETTL